MKAIGRVAFETPVGVWAEFRHPVVTERWGYGFAWERVVLGPVKIAVKRPAYGCLRCFRLGEVETCAECGGRCEELREELL